MPGEVERVRRPSVALEIEGRRDQVARHFAKTLHGEGRTRLNRDADRRVEPFADHVRLRIVQVQIDRDVGIGREELRQQRRDVRHAE